MKNKMLFNELSNELSVADSKVSEIIDNEQARQQNYINLIASENIASKAVMAAQGSIFTNKYAEGYPHKRYYGGCEFADEIENLAIERLKKLFGVKYANVQPHSGSQANQAVFLSLLKPNDVIMGLSLDCGGHLTHGSKVNFSGKVFQPVAFNVDPETHTLNYDEIESLALEHKPKLIIAGFSAYSRTIDFARFRAIADKVGALLLADIAHISGLIATKQIPSPVGHAHVITSTTHKTLRGPRGGIIMTNDEEIAKKMNSGIFPGVQGGPLMHVIAAKAVAFGEALQPSFENYIKQVLSNAKSMVQTFQERGYKIVSGGTDTHLFMLDLRPCGLTGKEVDSALDELRIICNKNTVPFDPQSPFVTSGIRIGTPTITSRGFEEDDCVEVANLIADIMDGMQSEGLTDGAKQQFIKRVADINKKFS